jgi:hypothetical protein
MPGIFKKLSANDIKITPFEAHKQYNSVNLASIGAQTASLAWSGKNKSTFSTGSRQYYQIDKLYYRNYIQERANRLELNDATYTTQERRLYQSASLLSLSQKTFGSEVQPESFTLNITKGGTTYNIADDGFGNLYDTEIGKDNFPNEDNRVFYLAPVNGFKRADLTIDYETGNEYVNNPFVDGYSRTVYDDSYFQNIVTFEKCKFDLSLHPRLGHTIGRHDDDADLSRVIIENRPYLNFNDDDFCVSFYYAPTANTNTLSTNLAGTSTKAYILSKRGSESTTPLGSQPGGKFSTRASGALDLKNTPTNPAFPYDIYVKFDSTAKGIIYLERFDGDTLTTTSGSFYEFSTDFGKPTHILLQKTGSTLEVYKNGQLSNSNPDTTTKPCQNNADAIIFDFKNPDGTYYDGPDSWGNAFKPSQFQIWNRSMNVNEITMISQSITGTYPIGNLFYDNGFATLTHPKYMSLFDGGTLNTLKYKNTHLITENEYQCTMTEDEFEFTTNLSARKIPFTQEEELANFVTGSNFKPYVTTVGLYDDDGNCLVVGKLGQPIKASSETDTTFVIRFDT